MGDIWTPKPRVLRTEEEKAEIRRRRLIKQKTERERKKTRIKARGLVAKTRSLDDGESMILFHESPQNLVHAMRQGKIDNRIDKHLVVKRVKMIIDNHLQTWVMITNPFSQEEKDEEYARWARHDKEEI